VAAYAQGNAYNQLTGNPGTPILRAGASAVSITSPVANPNAGTPTGGALTLINSTTQAQALVVALADIPLLQNGVTKAYFGFRTYSTLLAAPTTLSVVGVASSPTAVPTPLLTEAQLNRLLNVVNYVEVVVDISTNLYSVWVDGIKIIDKAVLATGWSYLVFGANAVGTIANATQAYRDFYFVDADTTTPNTRLGPITSALAQLSAVTAPNYTSSDGKTPLQDFQTGYSGAPGATPNLANAATNDPLTVNFSSAAPAGVGMIAVQYKVAANMNPIGQMSVKLANGTDNKALPNYAFADLTMDYGRDVSGVQLVDPSGNAWSDARFGATQLIVQPVSTT
jgi:hypothetical protein